MSDFVLPSQEHIILVTCLCICVCVHVLAFRSHTCSMILLVLRVHLVEIQAISSCFGLLLMVSKAITGGSPLVA